MANLTIKNVPEQLRKRLKERAARYHRSINSEVIACLEQVLGCAPMDPEVLIAEARELREQTEVYVTDEDLRRMKEEGRP